jgi:DNA-binding PadR family transcriptional regulator
MKPYRNEPWSWRGPRGSYYGRGGVKFAILGLLKEKPRHGYDIIREMEERSGGVYSPSPGVIYPTLQALEDQDYVRSLEEDGKKVYSVTETGLAYLQQNIDQARARSESEGHWTGEEAREKRRQHRHSRTEGRYDTCEPHWVRTDPGGPGGSENAGGPGGGATGGGRGPHTGAAWGTWFASSGGPELMREMRWMFGDVATAVQRTLGDRDKMNEIREVLRDAKAKIDEIVLR